MESMQPPELIDLSGTHVRLATLRVEHVAGLYAASDPRIWEYAVAPMGTLAEMDAYVQTALAARAAGHALPFVVMLAQEGTVIGSTRYGNISVFDQRLEIGWSWLHPKYWGTLVNLEAKYLLLRHAFETLGVIRVEFKGDALNLRSRRALEKIGATFEGVLRQHQRLASGRQRDTFYYSILLDEWPHIRLQLEARLSV